jgi:hypothetical protein
MEPYRKFRMKRRLRWGIAVIAGVIMAVPSLAAAQPNVEAQPGPLLGQIGIFPYGFCPVGWEEADGRQLPIDSNSPLFALLGARYGGDGQASFALPDLRQVCGSGFTCCIVVRGTFPARPLTGSIGFTTEVCPSIDTLRRDNDTLFWSAPGGWTSDSESFAREIGSFLGARWAGINVGDIICLYVPKDRVMFPVALRRNVLVPQPSGGHWGRIDGDHIDCRSTRTQDCPFAVPHSD